MSDSPKKPGKPVPFDESSEEEEDIFLKTKVGSSSEENPEEILEESPQETVDSFEVLEEIQGEIQLDNSPEDQEQEQIAPTFDSTELGDLSFQEPAEQQFAPGFSQARTANAKTIDSIKNYSESLNAEAPASAQLPFTLRIEGKLTAQESEKLLDVLSREQMDIREVDIEPQLEAGRVLIPRISEYAGVLLIQALRGVRAKIYFGPSDLESIHSSGNSNDFNSAFPGFPGSFGDDEPPLAESLPVTQGDDLPQLGVFQVIDTLIVSGMLSTKSVEALNSNEFTTLTEALMRELKFKAVRRGARGITHLSIQLTSLTLPTDYRVTLSGTAVR